jgi:hypothetical protein
MIGVEGSLQLLTLPVLKKICTTLDCKITGKKQDLVDRVIQNIVGADPVSNCISDLENLKLEDKENAPTVQ